MEQSTSSGSNASADALLMLNALLSATSGTAPTSNRAASSTSSSDATNLASLLDTLADFSSRVNTNPTGDNSNCGNGNAGGAANATSATDIASMLLSSVTNMKTESRTSPRADEFERYEREREQKYRDLEKKFAFMKAEAPRKRSSDQDPPPQQTLESKIPPPAHSQPSPRQDQTAASVHFASSVMAELLSTLHRSHAESSTIGNSSTKPSRSTGHKRRSRSSSSSGNSTSSVESSSSAASEKRSKPKKSKGDRGKKPKKTKSKKEKHKNGKRTSAGKEPKLKKNPVLIEQMLVMERVEKLKIDLSNYTKRRRALEEELFRLRKQHNEMCRRLQRQKSDPRKDPLINNNETLQSDIEKHLKDLDKHKETDEVLLAAEEKRLEKLKELAKSVKKADDNKSGKRSAESASATPSPTKKIKMDNVEYFDPGSHWCRRCNSVSTSIYEWLEHLHSQKHKSYMDSRERPWVEQKLQKNVKTEIVQKPFRGIEFLMPATAFYCQLCNIFSGDSLCAEDHLKSEGHNASYQTYRETNPFYERREMLEKAAAASHQLDKNAINAMGIVGQRDSLEISWKPSGSTRVTAEPQRVPHKPNESGKIKPFRLSGSSSAKEETRAVMKLTDPKPTTTSLKKPHSAFLMDPESEQAASQSNAKKWTSSTRKWSGRGESRTKHGSTRHSDHKKRYEHR